MAWGIFGSWGFSFREFFGELTNSDPLNILFIVGVSKLFVNHGTTHQQPDLNHLGTGLAGANFFSINFNHPGWRMLAPVKLGWCHGTQSA